LRNINENENFVLETLQYDPFDDDSYSLQNRLYLFNSLADYLTDEILEDQHKTQSCIAIVKTLLQIENIDREINRELATTPTDADALKALTSTKNSLVAVYNSLANENAISAKTNKSAAAKTMSLTGIMREMEHNGYEQAKTNYTNSMLTSEAYRHIADISSEALLQRARVTDEDLGRVVKEQHEEIRALKTQVYQLKEENRLLKQKGGS